MQARRTANLRTSGTPSQPSLAPQPTSRSLSIQSLREVHRREGCVPYIHQIYGLFGDGKPMSDLFITSRDMWTRVAEGIGAKYILWTAPDVESLMKQRYPQFWDMYCGVRYPIMRVDIGRVAIIHTYGGLYSDLDVMPNRLCYEQADLVLARVTRPRSLGMSNMMYHKRKRSTAKKKRCATSKKKDASQQ